MSYIDSGKILLTRVNIIWCFLSDFFPFECVSLENKFLCMIYKVGQNFYMLFCMVLFLFDTTLWVCFQVSVSVHPFL